MGKQEHQEPSLWRVFHLICTQVFSKRSIRGFFTVQFIRLQFRRSIGVFKKEHRRFFRSEFCAEHCRYIILGKADLQITFKVLKHKIIKGCGWIKYIKASTGS